MSVGKSEWVERMYEKWVCMVVTAQGADVGSMQDRCRASGGHVDRHALLLCRSNDKRRRRKKRQKL